MGKRKAHPVGILNDKFLRILRALENGADSNAIADQERVTRQFVNLVRKRAEAAGFFAASQRLSYQQRRERRNQVLKLASGHSVTAIAQQMKLSPLYVRQVCANAGITAKPYKPPTIREAHRESVVAAKCIAEILVGIPPGKIAKRHNVDEHYLEKLKRIMREAGAEVPKPGRFLSGEAIRYIGMAMRFLSIREAVIAFGLNKNTVSRIAQQSASTNHAPPRRNA
jgi:hypothetical protein